MGAGAIRQRTGSVGRSATDGAPVSSATVDHRVLEDTDLKRSTEEAIETVIGSLRWLGLDWDEGPGVGGPYGPYRQTERLDLYRRITDRFVDEGRAYPCYDTPEELDTSR